MVIAAIDYKEKYEESLGRIQILEAQLQQLKKLIYGSRHERFVPSSAGSGQLSLGLEAEQVAATSVISATKIEYTRTSSTTTEKKDHPGRTKLPDHLERKEIIIEPTDLATGARKIGEEITEELEYLPGKLFVNRYVRPKYVTADNNGIVIAPAVDRPLPKAIAGAGLLAQIVIDKYVDHLPVHRQQQRFIREGVNIPYSTITDWISNTCKLIEPLYQALVKEVLKSNYLHADESPIKVLDRDKKGQTHRGYFWVYHNSIDRLVIFDYQPGRGREGPCEMLKDFKGHLQTDGYSAYNIFNEREDITLLHCMAHARRMFYEARDNNLTRAEYALQQIGLLYQIEQRAKEHNCTANQLLQIRQAEALPILRHLGNWMNEQYLQVLPKSSIGKALGYSIERWKKLSLYATTGHLNIDNNPVENCIRPVAIGRKNYLFAGSHEAAQRSAMLYSLLGTCKLHDINPFIWLKDILSCIANQSIQNLSELLPHNWTKHTTAITNIE